MRQYTIPGLQQVIAEGNNVTGILWRDTKHSSFAVGMCSTSKNVSCVCPTQGAGWGCVVTGAVHAQSTAAVSSPPQAVTGSRKGPCWCSLLARTQLVRRQATATRRLSALRPSPSARRRCALHCGVCLLCAAFGLEAFGPLAGALISRLCASSIRAGSDLWKRIGRQDPPAKTNYATGTYQSA